MQDTLVQFLDQEDLLEKGEGIGYPLQYSWASLVAQLVKNLPANAGDLGSIPGSEISLEKEMATHSSILAWKISWTEEPDGLLFMGSQKSQT